MPVDFVKSEKTKLMELLRDNLELKASTEDIESGGTFYTVLTTVEVWFDGNYITET